MRKENINEYMGPEERSKEKIVAIFDGISPADWAAAPELCKAFFEEFQTGLLLQPMLGPSPCGSPSTMSCPTAFPWMTQRTSSKATSKRARAFVRPAMRKASDYKKGDKVELAPHYRGKGQYQEAFPTTWYVVGTSGEEDLKIAPTPNTDWTAIVHLSRIVGSGQCHWELR
jgi:hypothetical protein